MSYVNKLETSIIPKYLPKNPLKENSTMIILKRHEKDFVKKEKEKESDNVKGFVSSHFPMSYRGTK